MSDAAQERLRAGDLSGALEQLQNAVRSRPEDAKLRIFLFQLLCVLGDWKRAVGQLKVCAQLDAAAIPMAQTYREAIICEVFREKVFAGDKDALVFGEPQDWVALLAQSLNAQAAGQADRAAKLREDAFDQAPATPGEMDGSAFEWIADADSRLGPVLEIVINGKYFWMPFNVLARMSFDAPADLRDAVWMPTNLTLKNGGELVGLVPTRYAGTAERGSDALRLSRGTEWEDLGADGFGGLGQRLLVTDAAETGLMDVRQIAFAETPGAAGSDG